MMETTSTALSHASYARSQTGKIIFPMKDAKDCVFYGGNVVLGLIAFLATTENAGVIHIVCVCVCVCVSASPKAARIKGSNWNRQRWLEFGTVRASALFAMRTIRSVFHRIRRGACTLHKFVRTTRHAGANDQIARNAEDEN